MKHLKIGLGQIEVIPGDVGINACKVLAEMNKAEAQRLNIVLFPELCLSGYLIGDMWERPGFLKECEYWQQRIISASKNCLTVFGNVVTDWDVRGEDGRPRKYNSAIACQKGIALHNPGTGKPYFIKTLLPNYREFDDSRHFFDLRKLSQETERPLPSLLEPLRLMFGSLEIPLGITLCEDAWSDDYSKSPFSILREKGARIILNLSCSPYTFGKRDKRSRTFSRQAVSLGIPLVFVNSVGIQNNGKTVFTFDGASAAYDRRGKTLTECPSFKSGTFPFQLPVETPISSRITGKTVSLRHMASGKKKYAEICQALIFGARKFMAQSGLTRAVIGVSGGIDSAVSAALYASFLPPKNLLLVSMPSRFNSRKTRSNARRLAENLRCYFLEAGIDQSLEVTKSQLQHLTVKPVKGGRPLKLSLSDLDLENVQARDRSSRILAAVASAFRAVFTCNSNKAEMTVGYSTLYGDLGGFLALIGDLWKEDVYGLGRYLNKHVYGRTVIPESCFTLPPSAELGPGQSVDEGKGDPLFYPYHDKLFFTWVQKWLRHTPEENLNWYLEGALASKLGCSEKDIKKLFPKPADFISDLERWWNLYNGLGVAKRVQAPPILAVSSRAFGFDHREHIGQPFYSTAYLKMKKKALGL